MADLEETVQAAKAFLQKSENGEPSTYDHMVNVLKNILTQRPDNLLSNFEMISHHTKQDTFKGDEDRLLNDDIKSSAFEIASNQKHLFTKSDEAEEMEAENLDGECALPNLLELINQFEETGVCLGRDETYRIYLALKKLTEIHPLETCRFWGKIQGTKANYIVAQATFREGADEQEEEEEAQEEDEENVEGEGEGDDEEDKLPESKWQPPMKIPSEERGSGTNKFTFFVCNKPGDDWTRLPDVTPAQISCSRKIRKLFTGDLEHPICSYPPFPGNEGNYLRAQIARISAGTHIAPLQYFTTEEEEEEEEEGGGSGEFMENPEFEPIPVRELADPSLANWVHHVLHILPQGRTQWFNTNKQNEEEEEEEEEEQEHEDEIEPEVGPDILTSVAEDIEVDNMPPWTARISSNTVHPSHALAVLKSNLWVGATTFSNGKQFENIYIGWGLKYIADNYSPPAPPKFESEYPMDKDVTETVDPTVEEEQAFKKAQEEDLMNGGEDMEEEEEDEDEED